MTAVAKNGYALQYATEELRGDREVVMTAVAQHGYALEYATEELRGDKEIMEAALARAADSGCRPIGLKARLNPTWLPPLSACVKRGGKAEERLVHFRRMCCDFVKGQGWRGLSILSYLARFGNGPLLGKVRLRGC